MDLETLNNFTERLRKETIGEPLWIQEKNAYEYEDQSLEVISALKIIRAVNGVHSMDVLRRNGLFLDMGAIWRCVTESCWEVYFLLEKYPEQSSNVEKFSKEFFSKTIDRCDSSDEEAVQSKKIFNAYMRIISGKEQDENVRSMIQRVYKTNSGYIHASYAHIMEMHGGPGKTFNLSGIPSVSQAQIREDIVESAKVSAINAIRFAAQRFDLWDLYWDIKSHF